jgi:hypothetical protein
VALEEHEVAAVLLGRRVPEVVEADLVERRRRLEARDVPAELEDSLFARRISAIAFQRMSERTRCSSSGSPGISGSSDTGIVLTYGVLRSPAGCRPLSRASA